MVSAKGGEKVMDGGGKSKRTRDSDEEDNEPLLLRFKRMNDPGKFPPHPKVEGMSAEELERTPEARCKPGLVAAKECHDHRKSTDSARTPRDGDNGGGNHKLRSGRAEEVSLKKVAEDLLASAPRRLRTGFSSSCAEGGESFWDKEDFGLTWVKSQSLVSPDDLSKLESKDDRTLLGCIASDCLKALGVTVFFESRLQKYRDRLSDVEKEVKRLAEENSSLKESLQKGKDEQKKLMQELDTERSTGASFLQSEAGRRHRVSVEMLAVHDFMKSSQFKKLVTEHAASVVQEWAATRMGPG